MKGDQGRGCVKKSLLQTNTDSRNTAAGCITAEGTSCNCGLRTTVDNTVRSAGMATARIMRKNKPLRKVISGVNPLLGLEHHQQTVSLINATVDQPQADLKITSQAGL